MTDEVYLTAAELAERMNVCRAKIYNMVYREKLPCVKVGGSWRFPKLAIDQWLASNTIQPRKRGNAPVSN